VKNKKENKMKKKIVKYTIMSGILLWAGSQASAELLMEVDFSGSPGAITSIASTNSQVTTHSAVTYETPNQAFTAIGGGATTAAWNYDGTGTAAANNDLFTSSTFGGPTRFDLDLAQATLGLSYTITNVEIVVRASNTPANWEFGYRDTGGTIHLLAGGEIANQSGASPLTTYSIDLSGEGLTATDSSTAWDIGGTGELRILFYEATGNNADNLQISAIRLNGSVIPEPATLGLVTILGAGILGFRRAFTI
jgi:hypothetical protein